MHLKNKTEQNEVIVNTDYEKYRLENGASLCIESIMFTND